MTKHRTIQEIADVWTGRDLQRVLTVLATLDIYGYTVDDLREYISTVDIPLFHSRAAKDDELRRAGVVSSPCPECSRSMRLHRGDNNDCHWVCPACRYSVYIPQRLEDEMKSKMEEGKDGLHN
jgi:hypothetical protein